MKKLILITVLLLFGIKSYSQLNQIEATSGFHKTTVSHFSVLPASVKWGINLNTLSFFQKYHREQEHFLDEAGLQVSVLKNVTSQLSVGPTFYYNSFAGMMEKFTLSYAIRASGFNMFIMPSIGYSHKEKSDISELFIQAQYQKRLAGKWHVITVFQGLSNWISVKSHNRSFQYIRLGLAENTWQFGLAMDFDQYGPEAIRKTTPGLFLRKQIINN